MNVVKNILLLFVIIIPLSLFAEPMIVDLPNYSFKGSITTTASKERVWKHWTDVVNWKQFDVRYQYSYLDEGTKFGENAKGYVKGKGAPKTRFEIINHNPEDSFVISLKLPLYQRVELQRYFEVNEKGETLITHEVNFKGALKWLYYPILCGPFKKDLVHVLETLKQIAEDN